MVAGAGRPWPEHARDQLAQAVSSLLKAAPTPTAVVVQARTFGAGTEPSGSGRVFSRDPVGGAIGPFGEFRPGADRLNGSEQRSGLVGMDSLRRHSPAAAAALCSGLASIEVIHHDMCEVEFTLEAGQLFVHDARPGPRTSRAAVQIAVDLVDAGLIDVETALVSDLAARLEDLQLPVVSRRPAASGSRPRERRSPGRRARAAARMGGRRLSLALSRKRSGGRGRRRPTQRPRPRRRDIGGRGAGASRSPAVVCPTESDSRRPPATPWPLGRCRRATSPGVGGRASGLAAHSGEAAVPGGVAGRRPWILRISSAT